MRKVEMVHYELANCGYALTACRPWVSGMDTEPLTSATAIVSLLSDEKKLRE